MAIVTTEEAEAVMKRCQRGTTSYDMANNLHAACYGTIGALVAERDRLRTAIASAAEISDKAIGRAWSLGQTYWQQADSESLREQERSVETANKFHAMREEAGAALAVSGETT